jgi:hypothetical protein
VAARRDRHLELGADAVRGGDEDRILEPGRARVEKAAEAAKRGVRAGARCRPGQRLYCLDQPVPGIDVYACVAVCKAGFGGVAGYGVLAA